MAFLLLLPALVHAAGVKTYYKQYSIFTYENEDFLCEPYQVQKNDWLYKILRQKGEISETDFPKFLKIFQKINPLIQNIDTIAPGIHILIPLKKIDKQSYEQEVPGIVKVPVLEFSSVPKEFPLKPFIHEHIIQPSETISTILSKEFLKKGGSLTEEARATLNRLNPDIQNIDLIYPGTQVVIPDPSILSQPWFESFLKNGKAKPSYQAPDRKSSDRVIPVIPPHQMVRLERYAALIQGTLINKGHMHFPGKEAQPGLVLDLSRTPVIEGPDSRKILIIPSDRLGNALGKDLVENLKFYWKQMESQEMDKVISLIPGFGPEEKTLDEKTTAPDQLIAELLSVTPYAYLPGENISFFIGPLEMKAAFGRIPRPEGPDLLINTSSVYGQALEALEQKGYEVLIVSPGLTMAELTLMLLNRLGYSTWKNPSFPTPERVETLQGIYGVKDKEKIFISRQNPGETALQFLEKENIKFLLLTL